MTAATVKEMITSTTAFQTEDEVDEIVSLFNFELYSKKLFFPSLSINITFRK